MSFTQRLVYVSVLATGLCGSAAASLFAQQSVTREQAVAAALARGARAAFGRADTAAAGGVLHGARLYPNPSASPSCRSICRGSARRGSAPPPLPETPPGTASRSSAPRSGSTSIRLTPEPWLHSPA